MENEAIRQLVFAGDEAINCRDFTGITQFYTEDAVLVVRPGILARGREEIREAHRRISAYFNDSLEVSQGNMVILEAGSIALVIARTIVKSPLKPDSEYPCERDATYVYVRDGDGQWRCAIDNSYGVELLAMSG